MIESVAQRHYRQMFAARSPEQLRTLAHVKRFMERLCGDSAFRVALTEDSDGARAMLRRHGVDIDPVQVLPFWHPQYAAHRFTPDCAKWPLAAAWDTYLNEMLQHRELYRAQGGEMKEVNPRFHAWRARQMARCGSELGGTAAALTHPIVAFELSEGCTVGCWFCGISADRFKGYYAYSEDHARLWREIIGIAHALFGPATHSGFCYWATDPCDNPDYDRFLYDYYAVTGALPQTTTAAPLKDVALTRRVMALFDKYRSVTNRFSVLTLRQLDQIHATFTPEELMGVELVQQQKESLTAKADAGRARLRKLRQGSRANALPEGEYATIACVSGFLVSMMRGSIRLVTPVASTDRWPLGYRVLGERFFTTAEEFRAGIETLTKTCMQPGLAPEQPVRFRRDLAYEADDGGFRLTSRVARHSVKAFPGQVPVGSLIARGDLTASQLLSLATTAGEMLELADYLDQLFDAGLLDEDLDDTFANARNEGLVERARALGRAFESTPTADAHLG